jgi:hypothetical protein
MRGGLRKRPQTKTNVASYNPPNQESNHMAFLLAAIAFILEVVYFAQTKSLELWFLALVLTTLAVCVLTYTTVSKVFVGRNVG